MKLIIFLLTRCRVDVQACRRVKRKKALPWWRKFWRKRNCTKPKRKSFRSLLCLERKSLWKLSLPILKQMWFGRMALWNSVRWFLDSNHWSKTLTSRAESFESLRHSQMWKNMKILHLLIAELSGRQILEFHTFWRKIYFSPKSLSTSKVQFSHKPDAFRTISQNSKKLNP